MFGANRETIAIVVEDVKHGRSATDLLRALNDSAGSTRGSVTANSGSMNGIEKD